jgi:hypothetical protein
MRMRSTRVRTRLIVVAALVSTTLAFTPSAASAAFGISSFSTSVSTAQAGAHADVTTAFALNTEALGNPIGQLRDATITLPPGLIGNPSASERCPIRDLETFACGRGSQVGVLGLGVVPCEGVSAPLLAEAEAGATKVSVANAYSFCSEAKYGSTSGTVTIGSGLSAEEATVASIVNSTTIELQAPLAHSHSAGEAVTHIAKPSTGTIPLYNVEPSPGHTATFAASLLGVDIFVQANVKPDGRLTATISEASTLFGVRGATLTLWGVPAASGHSAQRCTELFDECGASPDEAAAFLTNPSDCTTTLETELAVSSWQGSTAAGNAVFPTMTGCEALSIAPSLVVAPSTTQRDTPSGYEVAVTIPQQELPYALATPPLATVNVTLPSGTSLSPALASGLTSCTDANLAAGHCPSASRIGTAEVDTPLLNEHLTGGIYIGAPTATEKYRVFVSVSAGSTTVNLVGRAETNETTGQVTAVFSDLPQLPFGKLRLNFFGGATAAFANPPTCGLATSTSQLTSSAGQTATPSSTFVVDNNGEGGTCPPSLPFAPSFTAGTTSALAGSFSPFTLTISRADGEASFSSFTAQLPPGLVGLLKTVPLCLEPAVAEGACAQSSEIGTATIAAGAGPQPLDVAGPVYLTGPREGAPFGLAIVLNVSAGPFNLGKVVVPARILVNPATLALTIASAAIPQILDGIPLRVRTVNITLGRPGFIVNPTSCAPQSLTAQINTTVGTSTSVATPFQVSGCSGLHFAPSLTASTQASASIRGHGAGLAMTVTNPANAPATTRALSIELPPQLRPRLSTLQHACHLLSPLQTPEACPSQSRVGEATVDTPALPAPLSGSIYLLARGPNVTPSLALLLKGDGITVDFEGTLTVSRTGTIRVSFSTLPDVPITTFALNLPRGTNSMLGAVASLCANALVIPYRFADQSGAQINGAARVTVSGCPPADPKSHRAKRSSVSRRARPPHARPARAGRTRTLLAQHGPSARAARIETINETLSLKISSIKGNTIYGHGSSKGAIAGTGSFNLTLQNASRATATFSGASSRGGFAGSGTGNYRVSGALSYFTGSVNSLRGNGGYAGAKTLGISVSGTVNRQTFTMTITLHGKWDS